MEYFYPLGPASRAQLTTLVINNIITQRANPVSYTTIMSFPYKHILLIGATSGIGKAMADKLIAEGIHITSVGRRQDRLDAFVSEYGPSKASSVTTDISKLADIPSFAEK